MTESRRGNELAEMSAALRAHASKANPTKDQQHARRALFQRIIQYLTIGIDMSPLFSDVIMNAHTKDMATKKMLYHYLTFYAQQKPDLALLTVNTLQKDCADEDPVIRGLAVRSMASMRVPDLVEYLIGAVTRGLQDKHPYPRKTAAMGVLKIHDLDREALLETEILQTVRAMVLTDQNAATVANCVATLIEIDGPQSLATKQIVYGLINRIKDFTEWSQVTILQLCALYKCANKTETFDVMNALEDRLQHSNSAVVLATVKCFLNATLELPEVHQQVFEKVKAPLLTLAQTDQQEPAYAVWAHLHLLVQRAPPLFATEYKSFFTRVSDAPAVKRLKIEMLIAVADHKNTYEICDELGEYTSDVDVSIAKSAINAICEIALRGDADATPAVVARLTQFVHHGSTHVVDRTLVALALITRAHFKFIDTVVASIQNLEIEDREDPDARVALVYMLAEFGDVTPNAPYLLEPALESFSNETNSGVKLQLLTSAMRLFFKRPCEMRAMLGKVLQQGTEDGDQDVHDRAVMYTRLLRKDPDAAQRVVGGGDTREEINHFYDACDKSQKYAAEIFHEFNTLSVVYRKPWFMFAPDVRTHVSRVLSADDLGAQGGAVGSGGDPNVAAGAFASDALIDFGDDGGFSGVSGVSGVSGDTNLLDLMAPAPMPSGVVDTQSFNFADHATIDLVASPQMDAATFQARWESSGASPGCVGGALPFAMGPGFTQLTSAQPLCDYLATKNFVTIASGGTPPAAIKVFAHAASFDHTKQTRVVFLCELLVDPGKGTVSVTIKSDASAERGSALERHLADVMTGFGG